METSQNLSCQCYYDASNQWNRNGRKQKMQRILSDIFMVKCEMIEMCSVNDIVYFLRFQSKIVYLLYIT